MVLFVSQRTMISMSSLPCMLENDGSKLKDLGKSSRFLGQFIKIKIKLFLKTNLMNKILFENLDIKIGFLDIFYVKNLYT